MDTAILYIRPQRLIIISVHLLPIGRKSYVNPVNYVGFLGVQLVLHTVLCVQYRGCDIGDGGKKKYCTDTWLKIDIITIVLLW